MSIELAQKAEELREAAGGFWEQHPEHPVEDWQSEVEADDTRLGYWEWLVCQIEQAEDDDASEAA